MCKLVEITKCPDCNSHCKIGDEFIEVETNGAKVKYENNSYFCKKCDEWWDTPQSAKKLFFGAIEKGTVRRWIFKFQTYKK